MNSVQMGIESVKIAAQEFSLSEEEKLELAVEVKSTPSATGQAYNIVCALRRMGKLEFADTANGTYRTIGDVMDMPLTVKIAEQLQAKNDEALAAFIEREFSR